MSEVLSAIEAILGPDNDKRKQGEHFLDS